MKQLPALLLLLTTHFLYAQETLPLSDMSFWKVSTATNWQIAGGVRVDIDKKESMQSVKGTGVLVNLPDAKNRANLLSVAEYGDIEVSFDFMMATHSNSGFYLQGRYEVQLLDSWGHQHPKYGDCGGVYARRRWNPNEQMYDGHAPRVNACLAPGLWQHMDIHFQAPRFDANGKKIANARMVRIMLNGYVIHENIELTGPTGGPISEQEAAKGPFMIQGDHGPVAFRNFRIADKSGEPVKAAGNFNYKVIYGDFRYPQDFAGKRIEKTGTVNQLTWEVAGRDNGYAILYSGSINSPKAGKHRVTLQVAGKSILKLNGKEVLPDRWTNAADQRSVEVDLPAGNWPFELTLYKMDGWMPPFLGLWIEGPGARSVELHSMGSALALEARDPIFLDAATPKVFRSFMDITLPNTLRGEQNLMNYEEPNRKRVVHAVQVGDPSHLHYTYNLDNGAVAQVWKGDFLYTSPMWDDRGDGSSRPRGPVLPLDDIQTLVPKSQLFDLKTSEHNPAPGFRPLGYDLDAAGYPAFRYEMGGMEVTDQPKPVEGKSLTRSLRISNAENSGDWVLRLAVGKKIEKVDDQLWVVDDHRYFVRVASGKPQVEQNGNTWVLHVPVAANLEWSILW